LLYFFMHFLVHLVPVCDDGPPKVMGPSVKVSAGQHHHPVRMAFIKNSDRIRYILQKTDRFFL